MKDVCVLCIVTIPLTPCYCIYNSFYFILWVYIYIYAKEIRRLINCVFLQSSPNANCLLPAVVVACSLLPHSLISHFLIFLEDALPHLSHLSVASYLISLQSHVTSPPSKNIMCFYVYGQICKNC